MISSEILRFFESRQAAIVDLIRELVEIESPSFDYERSCEVVSWIEEKFRVLSLDLATVIRSIPSVLNKKIRHALRVINSTAAASST